MVQDIAPGPWDSAISDITVVGSRVFFAADRSTLGEPTNYELWVMELRRVRAGAPAPPAPANGGAPVERSPEPSRVGQGPARGAAVSRRLSRVAFDRRCS